MRTLGIRRILGSDRVKEVGEDEVYNKTEERARMPYMDLEKEKHLSINNKS